MGRTLLVFVVLLAAAATPQAEMAAQEATPTATVRDSRFGQILFDGRGFVLYAFTKDPRGKSACAGACATAWPPCALVR